MKKYKSTLYINRSIIKLSSDLINIFKIIFPSEIILISNNTFEKTVVFLASLFINSKLHIVNEPLMLNKLIINRQCDTIIYSEKSKQIIKHINKNDFKNIIGINKNIFKNSFIIEKLTKSNKTLNINEVSLENKLIGVAKQNIFDNKELSMLCIYDQFKKYDYTNKNIFSAISLIELSDKPLNDNSIKQVDFRQSSFETIFPYILYFLFKKVQLKFGETSLERIKNKNIKKRLVILDSDELDNIYNKIIKIKYFKFYYYITVNTLNLVRYILNTRLIRKTLNLRRKDEVIIFNKNMNHIPSQIFIKSFVKTSFLLSTRETTNIYAINSHYNKKLKNNDYKIIGSSFDKGFVISTKNKIGQLLLNSPNIIKSELNEMTKNVKNNELYYNTNKYCNIKENVVTFIANKEDIYYDKNHKPTNIGFLKEILITLPIVKNAIVFIKKDKNNDIFLQPIVSIDFEALDKLVEKVDLISIKKFINDYIDEISKSKNVKINEIVILDSIFFNKIKRFYYSEYYFIKSVANHMV